MRKLREQTTEEERTNQDQTTKVLTGREIIGEPALAILNRKLKQEAEYHFYFPYKNEKGEVSPLSNLLSMRTTKLTIADLSNLYKEEEKEIIRIFKRKTKSNCLLVGDQIQINDLVTKIQLKISD